MKKLVYIFLAFCNFSCSSKNEFTGFYAFSDGSYNFYKTNEGYSEAFCAYFDMEKKTVEIFFSEREDVLQFELEKVEVKLPPYELVTDEVQKGSYSLYKQGNNVYRFKDRQEDLFAVFDTRRRKYSIINVYFKNKIGIKLNILLGYEHTGYGAKSTEFKTKDDCRNSVSKANKLLRQEAEAHRNAKIKFGELEPWEVNPSTKKQD
ncbi:MAG: hypothetical protein SFU98_06280 [Leptospiraceae bacterium]|nr:hypothetical protein [Leptospiraceae bacterium]